MNNENEINALIQLLDDNDHEVFKHVHDKLISLGTEVIPTLEQAWGADLNPTTHERLEEIIHEIQFDKLVKDWKFWLTKASPDLFTGAFLVAKFHYPEISMDDLLKKLSKLRQSIWLELNYNQTPLEQIQIFNQVFYRHQNFKGVQASQDYKEFCINQVLDSRKGVSVSIGIIYQLLANDLNLPVYGVNLIRHYILAFCKKIILDFTTDENLEREVMFYINPINAGSIFSRNEIKDYLDKMKVEQSSTYFLPVDNISIIKELLNYLIEIYTLQKLDGRCNELKYLLRIM